jgi:hypothetical protein
VAFGYYSSSQDESSYQTQYVPPENVNLHPEFDEDYFTNDISVLMLAAPVNLTGINIFRIFHGSQVKIKLKLGSNLALAALPSEDAVLEDATATFVGFGSTDGGTC